VEVERVQQLDGGIRRVHLHVLRHVEERLGVVEDDPDARRDEIVGDALCAVGRHGDDADDDVLLPDGRRELRVVADLEVSDRATDLVGVDVEDRGDVDPAPSCAMLCCPCVRRIFLISPRSESML
jgi:hypothetical protein